MEKDIFFLISLFGFFFAITIIVIVRIYSDKLNLECQSFFYIYILQISLILQQKKKKTVNESFLFFFYITFISKSFFKKKLKKKIMRNEKFLRLATVIYKYKLKLTIIFVYVGLKIFLQQQFKLNLTIQFLNK